MLPIRAILHPTDFSEHATTAYHLAAALARDYGARIIVAHIRLRPVVGYGQGVVPPESELTAEEIEEQLANYVALEAGVETEEIVMEGDPSTQIVHLAKEYHCDVIVLGTHGWTGLNRLLMGSVAEQVLRRAECPVLTIRNPLPLRSEDKDFISSLEQATGE